MNRHQFTADAIGAWRDWFDRLENVGPYHSPRYLNMLAGNFEYDSERAELFVYGDEDSFVYYPYIRRDIDELSFADEALRDPEAYSDIVSSWYYGGPMLSKENKSLAGDFVQEFSEYCKERNIISEFIRFDPNIRNDEYFSSLDPIHNRQTVRIDLSKSKEEIWDEYESRNQRAIRQARDSALNIDRTPNETDVEKFHSIYMNAMRARDASKHYRFSKGFFESLLDTSLFSLVVARYNGTVVGGFIVAHDDTYSHHYLSASNPDYWEYRVNNLLYHEVVMYMHATGRGVFDFQGGRPGVFKFKKGFSTEGRGEFYIAKQTHLPEIYRQLTDAAGEHGINTDTGYFPAYREEQSN